MSRGNGNKGPWGNTPSGGGNHHGDHDDKYRKPQKKDDDLEELLRKGRDSFKGMFGGGDDGNHKQNKRIGIIAFFVAILLWAASGVYFVNPDELGVVLRFGKYHRTTEPGPNYHLPYPFETVLVPSVTSVNKLEVGYRSGYQDRQGRAYEKESLMLTGDRNIVDIDFEVQWKIDSMIPQNYLFNVRNPAGMVKPVAESAMREVIGQNNLSEVLTTAQSEIADNTRTIMQSMLDSYEAGIEVIAVNLSKPDVPAPVIDEFQDVKRAEQDKETAESVAEGYRNQIIPNAKGEAAKMIQDASAYKNKVVSEAEGNVSRFLSVYEEYKMAKAVTKKRIYYETMEEILAGMNKIIIDGDAGNGVLPYLPLEGLRKKGGTND